MLRKPSQRRSGRKQEDIELPLIPIMDAFVTLIAFLLLATSLLAVTLIDTPVPVVSSEPEEKMKTKPLALQLKIGKDELSLSSQFYPKVAQKFPKVDKDYDLNKLHEALVQIRLQYPDDKSLVFMPEAEVKYDDLIKLMDASRLLLKTDPPMPNYKDKEGVERVEQYVFPNVVFGNVISGN